MSIGKDKAVSIAYQVKTQEGVLIDESTLEAPLEYLHGYKNLITGLEKALEGRVAGDKFEITVAPEEAYGEHLDSMVQRVPAEVFQSDEPLEVGMRFLADTDQGMIPVEITEVDGDEVVVDGNHMLAGETLSFEVEVIAVRDATAEEIEHGHIHREDGCSSHDHDHDHHHHDDEPQAEPKKQCCGKCKH